jgi:hypothetical protein
MQIMMQPHAWEAYYMLGLELDTRRKSYPGLFDEKKLRRSTGFEEL